MKNLNNRLSNFLLIILSLMAITGPLSAEYLMASGFSGGGGGATAYTGLTDTPANYTGEASKTVAVKSDETGLEYILGGIGVVPDASVRAYKGSLQAISNITWTQIQFDNERWDTDDMHDNVTNNTRLTCTVAGKYFIWAGFMWEGNSAGIRDFVIWLNGTTGITDKRIEPEAGNPVQGFVSGIYDLSVNDYVELRVYQDSGSTLDIQVSANWSPEFSMILIGGGGGVLPYVDTTKAGNVGAGEDTLITYNLAANSLSANGQGVRITAWGTTAANGNTKTAKLFFGTTVIEQAGGAAINNKDWRLKGVVFRTGASAHDAIGTELVDASAVGVTHAEPTDDTTAIIVIKVTGESGSAANDDVVAEGLLIEFIR